MQDRFASVNVVQSAFPAGQQGEISGLSGSISNLESSLGTAVAGTILAAGITDPGQSYAVALVVVAVIAVGGLAATMLLAHRPAARAVVRCERMAPEARRSRATVVLVSTPSCASITPRDGP